MVSTRVGYSGGTEENPSYLSIGSHSETVQVSYDPEKISYSQLLDIFWHDHNPVYETISRQYMSIVFYHDSEQKKLALESRQREENRLGSEVVTEILPFSAFYPAENYHQKYYLRREPLLMDEYRNIYPDFDDFVSSTAVARVNGYAGGYGHIADENDIYKLGLSEAGRQRLLEIAGNGLGAHTGQVFKLKISGG